MSRRRRVALQRRSNPTTLQTASWSIETQQSVALLGCDLTSSAEGLSIWLNAVYACPAGAVNATRTARSAADPELQPLEALNDRLLTPEVVTCGL